MPAVNTPAIILVLIIFLGFPLVILGTFCILHPYHHHRRSEDIEFGHPSQDVNAIRQSGESDIPHLPIQYPPQSVLRPPTPFAHFIQ
jgi:hypothetical protein